MGSPAAPACRCSTDLLIVDADVALLIQRHGSLSLHSVAFRGRSPIAQTREPLELSERYGCAAPRLYGDSCTRSGAAGQGWHQPGEASAACHGFISGHLRRSKLRTAPGQHTVCTGITKTC